MITLARFSTPGQSTTNTPPVSPALQFSKVRNAYSGVSLPSHAAKEKIAIRTASAANQNQKTRAGIWRMMNHAKRTTPSTAAAPLMV